MMLKPRMAGARISPLVILVSLGCSSSTVSSLDSQSDHPDATSTDAARLDSGGSVPDAPWSADCLAWETVDLPGFFGHSPNPCNCYAPPYCNCLAHGGMMTWACAASDEYCCWFKSTCLPCDWVSPPVEDWPSTDAPIDPRCPEIIDAVWNPDVEWRKCLDWAP